MTRFSGFGKPKGTWTRRTYGTSAPASSRTTAVHTRFKPFLDFSVTAEAAKRHGLTRTKAKGTWFQSEKQLNEYMAVEKAHGRLVTWKDMPE